METSIEIRPVRETDLESLREALAGICREKWYLASTEPFTLEQSRVFLKNIVENSLPQVVAVDNERIVGWCDIIPKTETGFKHVGCLGMGVVRDYRGKGIGRRLLEACLSLARKLDIEKVELAVYSDNTAAVHLYESVGFVTEGVRNRARKFEGRYQDIQLMAMWFLG